MFKAKKVESKSITKAPAKALVKAPAKETPKPAKKAAAKPVTQAKKVTAKARVERVSKTLPKAVADMKRFDSLVVASNEKVLSLLKGEKQAKTKRQLAKALKCSFNAAGRALRRLSKGTTAKLREKLVREGDRGPQSKAYYVDA